MMIPQVHKLGFSGKENHRLGIPILWGDDEAHPVYQPTLGQEESPDQSWMFAYDQQRCHDILVQSMGMGCGSLTLSL